MQSLFSSFYTWILLPLVTSWYYWKQIGVYVYKIFNYFINTNQKVINIKANYFKYKSTKMNRLV